MTIEKPATCTYYTPSVIECLHPPPNNFSTQQRSCYVFRQARFSQDMKRVISSRSLANPNQYRSHSPHNFWSSYKYLFIYKAKFLVLINLPYRFRITYVKWALFYERREKIIACECISHPSNTKYGLLLWLWPIRIK